jgi:putative ABC transport system substrate-binding protein
MIVSRRQWAKATEHTECGRKLMRQKFIGFALSAILLALCFPVAAQQAKKVPRIGYLTTADPSSDLPDREAFREGLRNLRYVEGQNIIIEYRYAASRIERLPELAADLVRLKVDVIFVVGTRAAIAVKNTTGTIPIVTISSDPLGSGLIESFARPGGNVTGLSLMFQELGGKRLELFRETFPQVRRLAFLWNAVSYSLLRETETEAQTLGFEILSVEVRGPEDFDRAFALLTRERPDGLFTFTSALLSANRKRIVEFAAKYRLPAIYHNQGFVEDGGLMSYAPSLQGSFRRAATYVDKILKGAKAADLPVEQPTKFEFIINLKPAKQMGLILPANVLARADGVIK